MLYDVVSVPRKRCYYLLSCANPWLNLNIMIICQRQTVSFLFLSARDRVRRNENNNIDGCDIASNGAQWWKVNDFAIRCERMQNATRRHDWFQLQIQSATSGNFFFARLLARASDMLWFNWHIDDFLFAFSPHPIKGRQIRGFVI